MGSLIRIADYRATREQRVPPAPQIESSPAYYCRRCHGESFRLSQSGDIICGRCRALMSNICVAERERVGVSSEPAPRRR